MSCGITYDKNGNIVKVENEQGQPSKLYQEALNATKNEEEAKRIFLVSKTPSFKTDIVETDIKKYQSDILKKLSEFKHNVPNLRYKVVKTKGFETIQQIVEDRVVGRIRLKQTEKGYKIDSTLVQPDYQGRGLGTDLYKQAIRYSFKNQQDLLSDDHQTSDAQRVWEKLTSKQIAQFKFQKGLQQEQTTPQILNEVIEQLKKTGIADNVFLMSTEEIDAKLKELGVSDDVRKQIIGETGAKNLKNATMVLKNLEVAKKMKIEGKDEITIKIATGWEYNKGDKKWRIEVDSESIYKNVSIPKSFNVFNPKEKQPLEKFFKNKELFRLYPNLKEYQVMIRIETRDDFLGAVSPKHKLIILPYSSLYLKRTLVHEIQHIIQEEEGFAVGGSPDLFTGLAENKQKEYNRLTKEIKNIFSDKTDSWKNEVKPFMLEYLEAGSAEYTDNLEKLIDFNELSRLLSEYRNIIYSGDKEYFLTPEQQYNNLAGEVEARNAQERMYMTMEQKQNSLLSSTEDVAEEDKIYIQNAITIEEQIRFSKNGIQFTTNGFIIGKDIYINKESSNPLNTSIHEYGHAYLDKLKEVRPNVYNKGLELTETKEAQPYTEFVKQNQPDLEEGSEKFKNEVLAQIIGDSGERLIKDKKKSSPIKEWLSEVWDWIKNQLGLSQYTDEQVANMTLQEYADAIGIDLLRGEKLFNDNIQQAIQRNNGNPLNLAPNGKPSILYQSYKDLGYSDSEAERLVAQVYSDEFISWFGDWTKINVSKKYKNKLPLSIFLEREGSNEIKDEQGNVIGIKETYYSKSNFKYKGILPGEILYDFNTKSAFFTPTFKGRIGLYDYSKTIQVDNIDNIEDVRQALADLIYKDYLLETDKQVSKTGVTSDSEVSKVVDYNGQPLLVHHTGSNKIDVFTKGKETGAMYFASNIETSKTYNGLTSHYFLNIRNPKIFDTNTYEYTKLYDIETGDFYSTDTAPRLFKEKKGNDGVIAIEISDNNDMLGYKPISDIFITTESNQIKSATENVGTFSTESNDIRYSKSNQEYSLKEVYNYMQSKNYEGETLNDFEVEEAKDVMLVNNINDSQTLLDKLTKAFIVNDIFKPTLQSLKTFYSDFEAKKALESLGTLKSFYYRLKNTIPFTNDNIESDKRFLRVRSFETNSLGKVQMYNPLIEQEKFRQEFGGIKDETQYEDKSLFEQYSKLNRIAVVDKNNEVVSKNKTKEFLEITLKDDVDGSFRRMINVLLNTPSELWNDIDVNKLKTKIFTKAIEHSLDLKSFENLNEKDSKELLTALHDTFENSEFDILAEVYDKVFSIDNSPKEFVTKDTRPVVKLDEKENDFNLFKKFGLLPLGNRVYLKTDGNEKSIEEVKDILGEPDFKKLKSIDLKGAEDTDIETMQKMVLYSEHFNTLLEDDTKEDEKITDETYSDVYREYLKNKDNPKFENIIFTEKGFDYYINKPSNKHNKPKIFTGNYYKVSENEIQADEIVDVIRTQDGTLYYPTSNNVYSTNKNAYRNNYEPITNNQPIEIKKGKNNLDCE